MYRIFKRVAAYIIDMLIIVILTNLLSNTTLLNKNLNKYQKYYKEYSNITEKTSSYVIDIQKYYKDKKITEEEYNKLLKKYPEQQETLDKYYKDNKLTEKNYNKLIKKTADKFQKEANKLSYKLEKNSISQMIIYIVLTILYFVIFNYYTEGQTLGKKILNIKIVNNNESKKLKISNYLIRATLMYQLIYYIARLSTISFLNQENYITFTRVIYNLQNTLDFAIVAFILIRNDGRGLHDILAKTKVISYKKKKSA